MNPTSSPDVSALLSFIGYGNPTARLRFMGVEEGLGGALVNGEAWENIWARCGWTSIMDMYWAHLTLREQGQPIEISRPRKGSTTCWRFMARIARAVDGHADYLDATKAVEYVRTQLGRTGGGTFLTELSPVPARRSGRPDLPQIFVSSASNKELLAARHQQQLELLHRTVGITICFGWGMRDAFASHLGVEWRPIAERLACSEDNLTFLMPYFGNGQMSEKLISTLVNSPEFQLALQRTALV
jgi:hypothetical protein